MTLSKQCVSMLECRGRAEDTDDLQGLCDWCMRERNGEHADWRKVTNSFKEGLIRIHNDFFGQIKVRRQIGLGQQHPAVLLVS
jgi:hypothetical protein